MTGVQTCALPICFPVTIRLAGVLIVSGLEQVADHMLGVEILTEFLARKGENL